MKIYSKKRTIKPVSGTMRGMWEREAAHKALGMDASIKSQINTNEESTKTTLGFFLFNG